LGDTENQQGTDIHFCRSFRTEYFTEKSQTLKLVVYPSDNNKFYEEKFELQSIMRSKSQKTEREIIYGNTNEKFNLHLICENCLTDKINHLLTYKFYDIRVINLNATENSKVFFEVFNFRDKQFWRPMYQSETVINTVNPRFNEFSLFKELVCGNNFDSEIKIAFNVHDKGIIGEAKTSINGIYNSSFTDILDVNRNSLGKIGIQFMEYRDVPRNDLMSTLTFTSIIGMDFTESNGIQSDPKSLHYVVNADASNRNPYQMTLIDLERLLIYFNKGSKIPFFGFGGIIPGGTGPNHCFDIYNFLPDDNAIDFQGIMTVYNEIVKLVKLSAPTYISPLLEYVISRFIMASNNNPYNYYLLWIFIDGDIDDIVKAEKVVEDAGQYGLSILICGVGEAKFDLMNEFSNYLLILVTTINKGKRPFAHFVRMRDYKERAEVFDETLRNSIFLDVKNYFLLRRLTTRRSTNFY
jgi:hypothetical protein